MFWHCKLEKQLVRKIVELTDNDALQWERSDVTEENSVTLNADSIVFRWHGYDDGCKLTIGGVCVCKSLWLLADVYRAIRAQQNNEGEVRKATAIRRFLEKWSKETEPGAEALVQPALPGGAPLTPPTAST